MKNVAAISFVVPVYNEEGNLRPLSSEITEVASSLSCPVEILFVDDGSTDGSLRVIKELAGQDPRIRYLSLSRNCGQSAALAAAFAAATGDVIVTMDADLQNDCRDLPRMLELYGTYDMVTGWRHKRQDSVSKKIASRIGNSVRNFVTGDRIHDTGCSLKVMNATLVKRIKMYRGLHRFLPLLIRLEGGTVVEVPVNHRPRLAGTSKYSNLRRGVEGLYDLLAVRWMMMRNIKIDIRETNQNGV